ncbi:MAG TPA: hypothetical protein VG457_11530 [Planctomycetota bacterium]|nr:hypothetical protein [Planctomycetota bacterium]
MNRSMKHYILVLCGVACLGSLPAAAMAGVEDGSLGTAPGFLAPGAALPEETANPEETALDALPTQLDSWGEDPREYGDFSILTLSAMPQGRLATKPPFIDFDRTELGAFVGIADFSSKFKASSNFVGGVTARVPVPGLPGDWGIWADLDLGEIKRKLPFFYPHQSGTWYGGTIGGDYTFTNGEVFVLRGQVGIGYTDWNGVQSLTNGMGGTVGMDFAFYWIKHYRKATIDFTPQITFSGANYYILFTVGFQVEF